MKFLGIHIDSPFLYLAKLQKKRSQFEICSLQVFSISSSEEIKKNLKKRCCRITSGLSSQEILIKQIETDLKSERHLEKALAFQAETLSFLDPETVLTVSRIQKKEESTKVLLFTISKEALKNHLALLSRLSIEPDCVTPIAHALCRFFCWKNPSITSAIFVHLGSEEWTCASMEEKEIKKSFSILGGNEELLHSLGEDRKKFISKPEIEALAKQFDLLQLKPHLNPHLSQTLERFRKELSLILLSLQKPAQRSPVIFTGHRNAFAHLLEYLLEEEKDSLHIDAKYSLTEEEELHAVSIGLALENVQKHPLQFLKEEFFPAKTWKKLGCYSLSLGIGALLLSGGFLLAGTLLSQKHSSEMATTLSSYLEIWDPQLKKQLFSENRAQQEILEDWLQVVKMNSKEFPYILQAPRVSEMLSWLSSHPVVQTLKQEGDPLCLKELRYELVDYPHLGSTRDPYLAKMELEFQVRSPMRARKFHEALLKGDQRVDPHLEIGWETLSDGYRVSFFLKNRGPHVP